MYKLYMGCAAVRTLPHPPFFSAQGCGPFLLFCTRCPQTVLLNGTDWPFDFNEAERCARFEIPEREVLLNEIHVLF
jgi:hypothetical protein